MKKAGVARGSFQNLFSTKDAILMELVGTMFSGQFGVAKNIVGDNMSPIYTYAVETAIQITLTELNEISERSTLKLILCLKRLSISMSTLRRN